MTTSFHDFYQYFKQSLLDESEKAGFKDLYQNKTLYSEKIRHIMSSFRYDDGIKYSPEYFKIDYTWWLEEKVDSDSVNIYSWDFLLAVEHENEWNDWTQEMAKLDCIHARVKIVIGYMPDNKRQHEVNIVEEQRKHMKHLVDDEESWVILLNNHLSSASNPFDFRCYRLTKEGTLVL